MGNLIPTPNKLPAVLNAALGQNQLDQHQYLTFMLGGETYAMGILTIKEIIEYGNLTEVPRMPAFIRADFMHGMGKVNGKFVIVLNIHHVLSVDEMAGLAGVAGGGVANA